MGGFFIMGRNTKVTVDEMKEFITNNSDCKVIDIDYAGSVYSKIYLICACGNEYTTTFRSFKYDKKRQCDDCGNSRKNKGREHSLDEVREYLKANSTSRLLSTSYKNRRTKLDLQCECGEVFQRTFMTIMSGKILKCQKCINKEKARLNEYSEIKEYIESNSNCILISTEYKGQRKPLTLQCECGELFKVSFTHFKHANQQRCKKCSQAISSLEAKATEILVNLNEEFITQYKFSDCKDILCLPFDFYLPNKNLCIEIDGQHHYKPVSYNRMSDKEAEQILKDRKRKDAIKTNYCKEHNIKLLRIPYWEFENMDTILRSALS